MKIDRSKKGQKGKETSDMDEEQSSDPNRRKVSKKVKQEAKAENGLSKNTRKKRKPENDKNSVETDKKSISENDVKDIKHEVVQPAGETSTPKQRKVKETGNKTSGDTCASKTSAVPLRRSARRSSREGLN